MAVTIKQIITWLVVSSLVKTSTDALMSPRIQYEGAPIHNNFTYSPNRSRKRSRNMMQVTAADHLVTDLLPLLDKPLNTSHYAGYVHLGGHDDNNNQERNLFYWLFAPSSNALNEDVNDKNIPLVIWLNGGPGYSSLSGLFIENGPFRFTNHNDKWIIQHNKYSWHKAPSYLLYVDQPVGTGFSFVSNDENDNGLCPTDECIAEDFYNFLTELIWLHRDTLLDRPIYITGESYAGHYIPIIADYIVKRNEEVKETVVTGGNEDTLPPIHIPLSGIAIGNGWMDLKTQSSSDSEYLAGKGLISRSMADAYDMSIKTCIDMIDDTEQDPASKMACFRKNWNVDVLPESSILYSDYDTRVWLDKGDEYPKGKDALQAYLGGDNNDILGLTKEDTNSILNAIHASSFTDEIISGKPQRYKVSAYSRVGSAMYSRNYDLISVNTEVARLLEETQVRVLFYNGMEDAMCDHVGNERFLDNLPWKGRGDWVVADRRAWIPEALAAPYGFVKQYKQLSFIKILGAGHMLPMDKPVVALVMIRLFINGGEFSGPVQPMKQMDPLEASKCKKYTNQSVLSSATNANEETSTDSIAWVIASCVLASLSFIIGRWSSRRQDSYGNIDVDDHELSLQTELS